jgi:hypothetical protein
MKFSLATLLLLPAMASAFVPSAQSRVASTSINAAKTFEEDLELTREVISKFMESQGEKPAPAPAPAPKKEEKKEE